MSGPARTSPLVRFERMVQVDETTGCWMWIGPINHNGYGTFTSFTDRHRTILAHRFAYSQAVGPIPTGFQIDHLCRTRSCVNPGHLEAVTAQQNNIRNENSITAANALKTHCIHGHEFNAENTRLVAGGRARQCKTCVRVRSALRYALLTNNPLVTE